MEIKVWLLVFILLTQLLLPWELCFINIDNDELAGGTIIIWRTIVPYWKDAVGLGSIICHTKSKKKDENSNQVINDEPFIDERKPSSTMAVKGVLSNGPSPKKMDGNSDQVVNDKLFIDERKPSSMSAVKGVLNNGEHTLIPVTVKMIYSAV
jgi:hypothetical protein